ncbi:MAG: aconitate hydratase AcnA [Deltaproteobacteria bacterium]|nr:aconitate hydratase AcnA [Deltaproteobacteria bacterium]
MTNTPGKTFDPFGARDTLTLEGESLGIYKLSKLEQDGIAPKLKTLPYSIRILLEAVLRNCDGFTVTEEDVRRIANWNAAEPEQVELPFKPARVILQDFTGVPVCVDIAAMRSAVARMGGDPKKINPLVPVDLVIDHSVQIDDFGRPESLGLNARLEFKRNQERYEFLKWAQKSVDNFRAVPPATGIVHQVNLEFLAEGVMLGTDEKGKIAYPDTLVGTDSHTTMINGLGVLGWGVGGIEAEAAMLGQPMYMVTPKVVGMKLSGKLREGVTATDLVLTVTEILRSKGVVDKFVEFYGPALSTLPLADRATIANMAPEYGATMGFFPVDEITVAYMRRTGRTKAAARVEAYCKAQGLWRDENSPDPVYTSTVEFDLSTVEPSLAGPKRPQDRIALSNMKTAWQKGLRASVKDRGFALSETQLASKATVSNADGSTSEITHGAVVIAAITSCTNTSNPSVMMAAGLVAQKALAKGLNVKPWVKTSLAPGSKVVTEYLRESGLLASLEALKFHVVGYGCTTCIGNSGPLPEEVSKAIVAGNLVASSVLSGNRNFEGRINPHVKANYLASPPLVVAYAIAGTTDIDLTTDALGTGSDGKPVFLKDIWPSQEEVANVVEKSITPAMFERSYGDVFQGSDEWNAIKADAVELYTFDESSTYIQEPPFFMGLTQEPAPLTTIANARVLALLGDSVTTDHISPAGDIAKDSPAGAYLEARGVSKVDFNSYGARRGNDRVMVRGTFANIRLKNLLLDGVEGGMSVHLPSKTQGAIFDVAERYKSENTALIVLAGKEYGTGSSRDWAAKGTLLLGVRAVIAESFERIHRANLVGMGVLPLVYADGKTAESLGLNGRESFDIPVSDAIESRQRVTVTATREDGTKVVFDTITRLDTPVDVLYYKNGGILQTVLRNLARS